MSIRLSVVMPCLNESETLPVCIRKAQKALQALDVESEIIVADNGSTDDSVAIAESFGARVVHQAKMGTRLKGRIEKGAMPWLHRYIGNPLLTGLLNAMYHSGISDAHCGMRSFTKTAYQKMNLRTGGMEFASEMVIRASLEGLKMCEIPIVLHKDGRNRPPHLRCRSNQ